MSIQTELRQTASHTGAIETMETVLTPEKARAWLERNTSNRPVRSAHLKHLTREMSLRRWVLSPEPIVFAKSGRLLDGQHRLLACIQSGETIPVTVSLVENEDVYLVLDQGANRSTADLLDLPATVISPVQYLLRSCVTQARKVTQSDLRPLVDLELFEHSKYIHEIIKPKHKRFKAAPFRASYIMSIMLGKISQERAAQAYSDLSTLNMIEWTPVMKSLYTQFDDTHKMAGHNSALNNSWFMRGFYMFENVDADKNEVRITSQYQTNVANLVRRKIKFIYETQVLKQTD